MKEYSILHCCYLEALYFVHICAAEFSSSQTQPVVSFFLSELSFCFVLDVFFLMINATAL